jgi:hypothetical protein
MKISITNYGVEHTLYTKTEDIDCPEMVRLFKCVLLSCGFMDETIDNAFREIDDEDVKMTSFDFNSEK